MIDLMFHLKESLEFAVNVGCPNNCSKFCPQDAVLANYKGSMMMGLSDFKRILESVPVNVNVIFAGVSEPFLNPDVVDMVLHADLKGHKIGFFTTLVGAKVAQIEALSKVKFERFVLHLPDPTVLRLNFDPIRAVCEHKVWESIPVAQAMSMNDWFTHTNGREYLSRGVKRKCKSVGYCSKLHYPQLFVYPNGDVYLCCTDWALEHKIGNLYSQSYSHVRALMFKNIPYDLCRVCPGNITLKKYYGRKLAVGVKKCLSLVGIV